MAGLARASFIQSLTARCRRSLSGESEISEHPPQAFAQTVQLTFSYTTPSVRKRLRFRQTRLVVATGNDEVPDEVQPCFSHDRFRVELHSFDRERQVTDTHHGIVVHALGRDH